METILIARKCPLLRAGRGSLPPPLLPGPFGGWSARSAALRSGVRLRGATAPPTGRGAERAPGTKRLLGPGVPPRFPRGRKRGRRMGSTLNVPKCWLGQPPRLGCLESVDRASGTWVSLAMEFVFTRRSAFCQFFSLIYICIHSPRMWGSNASRTRVFFLQ